MIGGLRQLGSVASSLSSTTTSEDTEDERKAKLAAKMQRMLMNRKARSRAFAWIGRRQNVILRPKIPLAPNWTDILLWAVIKGKHSLSRRLWEQTEEPLRAAIIITRVTRHMAARTAGSRFQRLTAGHTLSEEELINQAAEYERWATGLLSRYPNDQQQIMDLLTRAPIRYLKEMPVTVWSNSVLDEATERAHPCMQFVAHPHSQSVLADYWHGNYVGSLAAIPRGTRLWEVFVQILIQFISLNMPKKCFCVVEVTPSAYTQPKSAVYDDNVTNTLADDWREDDEFCRAYFSATARREMKQQRDGEESVRSDGTVKESTRRYTGGRRRAMSLIARTTMAPQLRGGSSNPSLERLEVEDKAIEEWESWFQMQLHFWNVPKVRFALDTIFRVSMLLLQWFLVIGHFYWPDWMPSMFVRDEDTGQYTRVAYVDPVRPPYLLYSPSRAFWEVFVFVLAFARAAENLQHEQWSPFFFYTFVKIIEICNCVAIVINFVARLVISLIYAKELHEQYTGQTAISMLGTDACPSIFSGAGENCSHLAYSTRVTSDVMAVNAWALGFTMFGTFAYSKTLGHALTMLFAMISDSASVIFIIAWMSPQLWNRSYAVTTLSDGYRQYDTAARIRESKRDRLPADTAIQLQLKPRHDDRPNDVRGQPLLHEPVVYWLLCLYHSHGHWYV